MRHLGLALIAAAILFAVGASPALVPLPIHVAAVLAASPQPSSVSGDTRSAGEAPGFIGAPLLAIGAVLGLGLLAAIATIGYVRLTGGPGPPDGDLGPDGR